MTKQKKVDMANQKEQIGLDKVLDFDLSGYSLQRVCKTTVQGLGEKTSKVKLVFQCKVKTVLEDSIAKYIIRLQRKWRSRALKDESIDSIPAETVYTIMDGGTKETVSVDDAMNILVNAVKSGKKDLLEVKKALGLE